MRYLPPNFSLYARLLLLVVPLFLVVLSFRLYPPRSGNSPVSSASVAGFSADARRLFLNGSASANTTISYHLRNLTLSPHLAGTPSGAAAFDYVRSGLGLPGLETHTDEYSPLLSYPGVASLDLLRPDGSLIKSLSLSEPADPAVRSVLPYHAYSPSGVAIAPAVYVNLGRDEDYLALERLGVDVRGLVAVIRRGGGPRGTVVEAAAVRGAKAVLMFRSNESGGGEWGNVLLGGSVDPLTPGWAAEADAERLPIEDGRVKSRFPRIPSMPVSASTAAEILGSLGGPLAPPEWIAEAPAVVGVGGGPTIVNFTYLEDRKLAVVRNIISVIKGCEEPDRYVILGNHRDAWTYGAVDPNSGTAVLLDIAARYATLLGAGWRPKRTIILCSWDAEEFGMIGSTEWVEQNLRNIGSKAIAYLNLDCAVQGGGFFVSATPQLDKLLVETMKQVEDPDIKGVSLYETWVSKKGGNSIERLSRADSDFTPFLHHAGVPATDIYFGEDFPFYHTSLDSYEWMAKHGDPLFRRHVTASEVLGLLALSLADDRVLPFDFLSYSNQLLEHADTLSALLDGSEAVELIRASILELAAAAKEVEELKKLDEHDTDEVASSLRLRALNDRLMLAERAFLETEGLTGRPWFKHMLYSPPKDSFSKLSFFPGIADAIYEAKSSNPEGQAKINHEICRVARVIRRAADVLRGDLT
ncbi:hypothetical protein HPP92_018635 [Vanilla planifolia]|uniref:glutamate carboxypeptidase II n=1 Tax=Vanilla planifolia TaxID=51239 RepID=A0A835QA73_VANPL|nr:hypothetical protein HPP92_018635 [Vanilla planifolia]